MAGILEKLGVRRATARPIVDAAPMARPIGGSLANAETRPLAVKVGSVFPPRRDDHGRALVGDLTPERVESILRATVWGDPRQLQETFDRILERDAHIRAEWEKRHLKLTQLDWDVHSASREREGDLEEDEVELADEIAAYVRKVMARIKVLGYGKATAQGVVAGLRHLAEAVGRGLAGVEVEWGNVEMRLPDERRTTATVRVPIAWHCLAPGRFRYDMQEPWRLRVLRDDGDFEGILVDTLPPGKLILRAPKAIGGNVFRGGLHIPALMCYYAKVYGWKFFIIAAEIFGQPMRVAKYSPNATPEEIQAIVDMLVQMGATAGGVFSADTSIEMLAGGTGAMSGKTMHERLIEMADRAASKNYLGATLTTEVGEAGGNRALGEVHAEVGDDLRDSDINDESTDITSQLVHYIVAASPYAARGGMELVPTFRRVVPERQDDAADMSLLDAAVNRLGYRVPRRHVLERFGLPTTDEGDALNEPLEGAAAGGGGFGEGLFNAESGPRRGELRVLANRALDSVLKRRSPMSAIAPWLLSAILASQAHTANLVERFDGALKKLGATSFTVSAESEALPEPVAQVLIEAFVDAPTGDLEELVRQFTLATRLHGERHTQVNARRGARMDSRTSENIRARDGFEVVANADRIRFEKLPFVEAIEQLRDRIGLDPETFVRLDGEARSRAFRVAGVWNMDLLAVLHHDLVRALRDGLTPREYRLGLLPQMADRRGWTGENPWHADVVFYQNFVMSHAAGRFRQYEELGIGHWRFVSSGKACTICSPHVGKVFSTRDTDRIPPLHFYCDCYEEVVFAHELNPGEEMHSGSLRVEALVEERSRRGGFHWNVRQYAALEPVRIGKYPEQVQPAFAALAAQRGWAIA